MLNNIFYFNDFYCYFQFELYWQNYSETGFGKIILISNKIQSYFNANVAKGNMYKLPNIYILVSCNVQTKTYIEFILQMSAFFIFHAIYHNLLFLIRFLELLKYVEALYYIVPYSVLPKITTTLYSFHPQKYL